jgi:hypothetical protein
MTDLDQGDVVWVVPRQFALPERPTGFALRIKDFLGPGDPDHRGTRTIWVRGPVLDAIGFSYQSAMVCIAEDQPRAALTSEGYFRRPEITESFEFSSAEAAGAAARADGLPFIPLA